MDTLGTKIRRSGKGFSEQGALFFTNTRTASRELATFVHEEARDWGEYLSTRYRKDLGKGDRIWSHLDELVASLIRPRRQEEEEVVLARAQDEEQAEEEQAEGEMTEEEQEEKVEPTAEDVTTVEQ